jgi:hypothetical protein
MMVKMGRATPPPNDLDVSFDLPAEITANLRMIGSRTLRNATRNALGRAATVIKESARQQADFPVYSGILRQSLGIKKSKHTSKGIYALVGARRSFVGPTLPLKTIRKGKKAARAAGVPYTKTTKRMSKPSRYLHLVEKGFRHYRSGAFIKGHNMLRNAGMATKSAVAQVIREALSKSLTRATTPSEITTT